MKNTEKNIKASEKKIILTVGAVCLLFLLLCGAYYLISGLIKKNKTEETPKIKFYSREYSIDIMNDPKYLDLDRQFYFVDESNGTTTAIADENASDLPAVLREHFICIKKYLQFAIAGDSDGLNGLYSDKYYANGGERKGEFTEQKLYDIYIYGNPGDGQKGSFNFAVEYKIKHNNGSFREDMGSDCSKKEYFTVTDYNGNCRIDLIYTNKSVN